MNPIHARRVGFPAHSTRRTRPSVLLVVLALGCAAAVMAGPVSVTVHADRTGAPINPAMWGVFFEDINGGADGGLHAELVKNRSFEFSDPLMGWSADARPGPSATFSVRDDRPLHPANPRFLRVTLIDADRSLTLRNEGFAGMGVRRGESYRFSVHGRGGGTDPDRVTVRVALVTGDGEEIGSAKLGRWNREWSRHEVTLRGTATEAKARLELRFEGRGTLDLDMVSLFPTRTWKNRPGGLRADLVQMLADLKPGFVRFPGGCIVEGRRLSTRYQWKTTIGRPEERTPIINRWNDEFAHRPAPDYFQSFGLGFYEYFLLCEDLGAEPLPILNCGMACQFNSGELVPLDQLDPYIQDALDLIEFANGPADRPWGRRRAEMGHPKPFGMKMLGVGNEQWGPQYVERYAAFARVLKSRHPEIQLVSSAGPRPNDELFHFLWPKLRELNADIVDEHCYDLPRWFLDGSRRYDAYPRVGPKVFMGEYAAQSVKVVSPDNRNDWGCALAEAAFMTGLERNADVVVMSAYAPLFAHEERWQWRPNLIWFDNLEVYGTPSYYVQQLFARNRGDRLVPVDVENGPRDPGGEPRFYASATRDLAARELVIKLVNATASPVEADLNLKGAGRPGPRGRAIVLAGTALADENSLAEPRKVAPREEPLEGVAPTFRRTLAPHSFVVLRLPVRDR